MAVAIQITFRGIQPFEGAQKIVQDKLATLEPHLPEGARCHVTIERSLDDQLEGEAARGRVHARVHLLGTGLLVSTAAHDDDEAGALRLALARAEGKLSQASQERREPVDLTL